MYVLSVQHTPVPSAGDKWTSSACCQTAACYWTKAFSHWRVADTGLARGIMAGLKTSSHQ